MALLTLPTTPLKGIDQEYTLNVTELIDLISDSYFQDQANWSKVVVLYQSSVSNQLELINFIPDGVSTELPELAQFSTFARNFFEVHSITIFDNQNGRFILRSSDIPNVIDYSIFFSSGGSAGVSYALGSSGSTSAFTAFIDSENNFFSSVGYYGGLIGGTYVTSTLIDSQTNSIDYTITNNLNDERTSFVCFNDDLTKAYSIGAYNGYYGSSTFTPPSQYNYNQLIEVDLTSGVATLIAQLESPVFSTQRIASIFYIDGKLLITSTSVSGLYDLSSNTFDWTKNLYTNCGAKISGDYFYTIATYYDNGYLPYPMIVKVSISSGLRDMSFPQSAQISDAEPGNTFDVTPDGKVFGTGGTVGYFFDGTAWTTFTNSLGYNPLYCSIDGQQSKIYITFAPGVGTSGQSYMAQYDYSGNPVMLINNLGTYNYPPQEFCVRNNVLMMLTGDFWSAGPTFAKYNISGSTAIKDTSIPDIYANLFNLNNEIISVGDNKFLLFSRGGSSYYIQPVYEPQKLYFFKYGLDTNTYIDGVANVYDNGTEAGSIRGIKESPLLPGKLLLISPYEIKECDKNTYPLSASQNGWPTVTSYIADALISENYLYLCTTGNLNMSDSQGAFAGKNIARISLTTKLIDRTFTPVEPSGVYTTRAILSESDTYIYYNYATSNYGSANNIVRINKSTNAVEIHTDLQSFSGPLFCRVATSADGSLIVMPVGGGGYDSFSNRPYNVVDETTLVSKVNQPEVIWSGPNQGGAVATMVMHPTEKIIYAVVGPTSYGYFSGYFLAKYNPVSLTQQVVVYSGVDKPIKLNILYTPITFAPNGDPYIVVDGIFYGKKTFGLKKINPNLTLS